MGSSSTGFQITWHLQLIQLLPGVLQLLEAVRLVAIQSQPSDAAVNLHRVVPNRHIALEVSDDQFTGDRSLSGKPGAALSLLGMNISTMDEQLLIVSNKARNISLGHIRSCG